MSTQGFIEGAGYLAHWEIYTDSVCGHKACNRDIEFMIYSPPNCPTGQVPPVPPCPLRSFFNVFIHPDDMDKIPQTLKDNCMSMNEYMCFIPSFSPEWFNNQLDCRSLDWYFPACGPDYPYLHSEHLVLDTSNPIRVTFHYWDDCITITI
jgi:hypothetical protein